MNWVTRWLLLSLAVLGSGCLAAGCAQGGQCRAQQGGDYAHGGDVGQGVDRAQAQARLSARLMSFDAALRALRSPPDYPM